MSGEARRAYTLVGRALRLLEQEPDPLRTAWFLTRRSRLATAPGRGDGGAEPRRAEELVRGLPPSDVHAEVLAHLAGWEMVNKPGPDSLVSAERAVAYARMVGAVDTELSAHVTRGVLRVAAGDIDGGLAELYETRERALALAPPRPPRARRREPPLRARRHRPLRRRRPRRRRGRRDLRAPRARRQRGLHVVQRRRVPALARPPHRRRGGPAPRRPAGRRSRRTGLHRPSRAAASRCARATRRRRARRTTRCAPSPGPTATPRSAAFRCSRSASASRPRHATPPPDALSSTRP
ncbi:hypothetical protein GA0115252_113110 [Streptomyces sp. DfronAA-171]|nr:hypothetical protein GA0115252_113110 [Streptomyces sp. DfronAA-171]